jgi:hypothetical protein
MRSVLVGGAVHNLNQEEMDHNNSRQRSRNPILSKYNFKRSKRRG